MLPDVLRNPSRDSNVPNPNMKGREGKGREGEGKGRGWKGRKGREGDGREGNQCELRDGSLFACMGQIH